MTPSLNESFNFSTFRLLRNRGARINCVFMTTPMQRVEREVRARGMTLAEFAATIGVRSQHLNNWKNRGIPRNAQQRIADGLGWTLDYLLRGEEAATAVIPPPGSGVAVWETLGDLPHGGRYVQVPHYDVELSAGDGCFWHEHPENEPLVFRAAWFARKGARPELCRALYVRGESMYPTLKDNDTVLIDTERTSVMDDCVYAVMYRGELFVKRLFKLPGGGIELRSDNPRHPSREVIGEDLHDLVVLGQMIWRAG